MNNIYVIEVNTRATLLKMPKKYFQNAEKVFLKLQD